MRSSLLVIWVLLGALGLGAGQDATCPAGFTGAGCSICQNNEACVASTGNSEATCSNDIRFAPNSQIKSYSCTVTDALLGGLLVPGSLLVQCHTGITGNQTVPVETNGTNSTQAAGRRRRLQQAGDQPQPNAAFCDISFKVKSPATTVECKAEDCGWQTINATKTTCRKAACGCVGGCNDALINGLVSSATGPVSMDCQEGGICGLQITGLPVQSLPAECKVGECLVPTNETLNTTDYGTVNNLNTNPIIAAIPSMVLALIVLFLGSYTAANRHLWRYHISAADAEELDRLAKEAANTEPRLNSLEFKDLTVWVPVTSHKQLQAKLAALRAKALAQGPASAAQRQQGVGRVGSFLKATKQILGSSTDMEAVATQALAEMNEDALKAADYVGQLHTGGGSDQWYILKGLSFTARIGEVVGVLGPSGCGKTSLLGSIAGSASDLGAGAVQTGYVLVDGKRRRKRDVAYVPQSDLLIPSLTVQECLRYSALLRLPVDTQPIDLQFRIEQVLEELGLSHVAGSQVGGSGRIRGVSGGERRRVTIGMELVTDPAILILDEPTSGLDSFTAINLIRTLRRVAAKGRVVVASLHQPSRDMFLSLDQAILMAHGRMLYAGRPGDAEAWLSRCGMPCPEGSAIAEHMLQVASNAQDIKKLLEAQKALSAHKDSAISDSPQLLASPPGASPVTAAPAPEPSGPSSGSEVGDSFTFAPASPTPGPKGAVADSGEGPGGPASQGAGQGGAQQAQHGLLRTLPEDDPLGRSSPSVTASDLTGVPGADGGGDQLSRHHARLPGMSRQLAVLFWRAWVDMIRNPTLLRLHVCIGVMMGLITGLVFFNLSMDNVGVQNRMGGTFFALAFFAFASLTTVDLLMNERAVVMREVRGGYYSSWLYLLSKLTLDGVLLRMIPAVLYFFPFYYMAGFRSDAAYAATYVFCLISFSGAVGALSMAVTVAADTPGQASFGMNFLLLFSLIFTGFLVNVNSIPAALRWLHYLSVFYWSFEAMVTSEINGLVFTFQAAGFGEVSGVTGQTFLSTLGFNTDATTRNIAVLIAFYGGFAILATALFVLRQPRTSHGRRRKLQARIKRQLGLGPRAQAPALGAAEPSAGAKSKDGSA